MIKSIKIISFLIIVSIIISSLCSCNISKISQEEAYKIYCDTIKKMLPDLMTSPQECDVTYNARVEYHMGYDAWIQRVNGNVKSQNNNGKLQYYIMKEKVKANLIDVYCINNDKGYRSIDQKINEGTLKSEALGYVDSYVYQTFCLPRFQEYAILSYSAKKKGNDTELTFVVNGLDMDDNFGMIVMQDITATSTDPLDDVKIVLVIGKDGTPKTMSTSISMTKHHNKTGEVTASKKINMEFEFNKLDDVDFDFEKELSNLLTDISILEKK